MLNRNKSKLLLLLITFGGFLCGLVFCFVGYFILKINPLFIGAVFVLSVIFLILGVAYLSLLRRYSASLRKLSHMTQQIGSGNFDIQAENVEEGEIGELINNFNSMSKNIKNYVSDMNIQAKKEATSKSELTIANSILNYTVPSSFCENMDEFDVYATMKSAKEVGGDFYDYFFINPTQFMFLVADVAGTGIPAALFMMNTKELIKNMAKENSSPKRIIEKINRKLCSINKKNFFVTMFAAIMDISTGEIFFINCGHNPPLIKRKDGKYKYLEIASNLVLGVYPNFNYKIQKTKLNEGDILFLYTDGITEAMDDRDELYGETRLLICLNDYRTCESDDLKKVISDVQNDVKSFTGEREQIDDVTMLAFKYNGNKKQTKEETLSLPAKIENFGSFNSWIESTAEKLNIGKADLSRLQLVSEEVFVNIANYAYPDKKGDVDISFKKDGNEIVLRFVDSGVQYNPLEKANPDINARLRDRKNGGLGIFMVKKSVDFVGYEYKDNQNILTIKILYA